MRRQSPERMTMRVCARLSKAATSTSDDDGEVCEAEGHVVEFKCERRESKGGRRGELSWACDIDGHLCRRSHSHGHVLLVCAYLCLPLFFFDLQKA